jgi:FtsP/CotA-like multicopper oxidase with cupredoxin domain
MPHPFLHHKIPLWNRRQLLKFGLAGVGVTGAAVAVQQFAQSSSSRGAKIPPIPTNTPTAGNGISPMAVLRDFDYGTVKRENGRNIREFRIQASNSVLQLNSAVTFNSWNFNNRVPGPTLRATAGDRIRVIFLNNSGHAHTMHFHGIHPQKLMALNLFAMVLQQFMNLMLNPTASTSTTAILHPLQGISAKGCMECSSLIRQENVPRRMKWC